MSWWRFNGNESVGDTLPFKVKWMTVIPGQWGSPDALVLPSFGMFATVSLCFEGSFANVYFFHIFLSASAAAPPAAAATATAADGHQPTVEAEPEL